MRISRRGLLVGASAQAISAALVGSAAAAAGRPIDRRIALWRSFAEKSQRLVAATVTTRLSSLYADDKPRVSRGALLFAAPDRLVLRDEDPAGATTTIFGDSYEIAANDPRAARGPAPSRRSPALRWLARHLIAAFAPGDGEALLEEARLALPRGAGIALVVLPLVDSPVRRLVRSMTITLDSLGGAVRRIEVLETQGDRWIVELSAHQQGIEEAAMAALFEAAKGPVRPDVALIGGEP
jgi:hypothetical protein